eukprot:1079791-Alexandrium_andersonii.AAC.1
MTGLKKSRSFELLGTTSGSTVIDLNSDSDAEGPRPAQSSASTGAAASSSPASEGYLFDLSQN